MMNDRLNSYTGDCMHVNTRMADHMNTKSRPITGHVQLCPGTRICLRKGGHNYQRSLI